MVDDTKYLLTVKDYRSKSIDKKTDVYEIVSDDISNISDDTKSVIEFMNGRYTNLVVITTKLNSMDFLAGLSMLENDVSVNVWINLRNNLVDILSDIDSESQSLIICDIPLIIYRNNNPVEDHLTSIIITLLESVNFYGMKGCLSISDDKYIFLLRNNLGGNSVIENQKIN